MNESDGSRRGGLRAPLLILAVGGCLIAATYSLIRFNESNRFLAMSSSAGLTVIALYVWAMFFSGLRRATRRNLVLTTAAVIAGFFSLVKLEGCTGNNHPVFGWRWKEQPALALRDELVREDAKRVEVDLTDTTPDDSSQFLGPNRDARIEGVHLARDWSKNPPRLVWRHEVGKGWSSFAVVGDYAVTQEQEQQREWTICYGKTTGDVCWAHDDPESFDSVIGGDGPRDTPTIDQGRVYTFGVLGRLNCLDGSTGSVLWTHSLLDKDAENFSKIFPEWGKSCSPLVTDKFVIVSRGLPEGHSLEAYDKLTGELKWHAGDAPSAYDSPMLATLGGVQQVVIVNRESVDGHDVETGQHLWSFEWKGSEPKVPQPIALGNDRLLVAAGYGLGTKLLEVTKTSEEWMVREIWAKRTLKPKFTNIVINDGVAYAIDDGTALTCIDLKNGDRRWRGGRYGHGQILQAGDLLLVQAESGEVALVDATPEKCEELGRFPALADKTWNEPTLSGKYLLVRNDREAACYELPLAE
ncbi:MAG TPA: PQQ-binding-like beta-propeller repeat protein [Pirellulales bacterium]|nr:PQQ-binding-like beta-propeller repeat protein [Pirellulales bacterium]